MTSPSSAIPRGVGDRVLAVPPHLRRPNGRPRWSLTGTGRRGSEGVTLVYASQSRRLAIGAAGADRFWTPPCQFCRASASPLCELIRRSGDLERECERFVPQAP